MNLLALLFAAALPAPAAAQGREAPPSLPGFQSVSPSTETLSSAGPVRVPLPGDKGPWIIGEVAFTGRKEANEFALRSNIRARRGSLYTPSDIANDIAKLTAMPQIVSAKAEVYGMAEEPVPENYRSISISTMMVQLVYVLEEKELLLPGLAPAQGPTSEDFKASGPPPVSISGVVMTPTAYRGVGQYNKPGVGFDINAVYFIGRLYGKNTLSLKQTNFIDRIGTWFLDVDGKMQLQSETRWRPAMSAGARGFLTFRDAPQPSVTAPGVTVNISNKTTRRLSDGYLVFSKNLYGVRTSAGISQGNAGDRIGLLTEFLSPSFLPFAGHSNQEPHSKTVLFGSLLYLPKPNLPLAVEFLKPNGMVLNPTLINFKVGYWLKLNFDVAYLRFDGGWDLLGMFQFRFTNFPRTVPVKKS